MKQFYFIVGPTASGKTGYRVTPAGQVPQRAINQNGLRRLIDGVTPMVLEKHCDFKNGNSISEIVNSDSRQMYTALKVGVATPEVKCNNGSCACIVDGLSTPCHLFEIFDTPTEITAFQFRRLVMKTCEEVIARGNTPIIVGGSMFYVKSLFFPPQELPGEVCAQRVRQILPSCLRTTSLDLTTPQEAAVPPGARGWELLNKIDPVRAKEIHPNDIYRIDRALDIYFKHGVLPSTCKPTFKPIYSSDTSVIITALLPPRDILRSRIAERLEIMLLPWIEEVENLLDTPWEKFWNQQSIIGYQEIAAFIRNGKRSSDIDALKQTIFKKTYDYAKRQICFWRSFREALMPYLGKDFIVEENSTSKSK